MYLSLQIFPGVKSYWPDKVTRCRFNKTYFPLPYRCFVKLSFFVSWRIAISMRLLLFLLLAASYFKQNLASQPISIYTNCVIITYFSGQRPPYPQPIYKCYHHQSSRFQFWPDLGIRLLIKAYMNALSLC